MKEACESKPGWYTTGNQVSMCPSGMYQPESNKTACLHCVTGVSFDPDTWTETTQWVDAVSAKGSINKEECSTCTEYGKARQGSTSVTSCECIPGTYSLVQSTSYRCQLCAAGKSQPERNQTQCNVCGRGSYSLGGTDACISCPSLSFTAHVEASSLSECRCNMGYGGNTSSTTPCEACPSGHIQDGTQTGICQECGAGTYTSIPTAATACIACVEHSSSESASFGVHQCVCNAGYEDVKNASRDQHQCTSCAKGMYNDKTNSTCRICPIHTYSSVHASTMCTSCPVMSATVGIASMHEDQCLCNAGFTGGDDTHCKSCLPGEYKDVSGTSACQQCPVDTFSPAGATACTECHEHSSTTGMTMQTSVDACQCMPGYSHVSATNCQPCLAGTVSGTGNTECSSCGTGNISSADFTVCEQCPINTFQDKDRASECQACPSNTMSHIGSRLASDCFCVEGFTREGSVGACHACAVGTYKDWELPEESQACDLCPTGKTTGGIGTVSALSCTTCPANTFTHGLGRLCVACQSNSQSPAASNGSFACQCNAGYSPSGTSCVECDVGFYKTIVGMEACTLCPSGSIGTDVTTRDSEYTACQKCPENTYQTEQDCMPCMQHSSSVEGSSNKEQDCKCDEGYFSGEDTCSACVPGTYKSHQGNGECAKCANNTHSTESAANSSATCLPCHAYSLATTDKSACECDKGYSSIGDGTCSPCVEGTYKKITGPGSCISCPEDTYFSGAPPFVGDRCHNCPASSSSVLGSYGIAQCLCVSGYHRVENETDAACRSCRADFYCPDQYSENICPSHALSSEGSTSIKNCSCMAGFHGPPGGVCEPCRVNSYCTGGGGYTQCPPNSTTHGLGQRNSSKDCECMPGFYGTDEELCLECPPDSFCYDDLKFGCPANASSPKGALECTCDRDFRPVATAVSTLVCEECPSNIVCPGEGRPFVTCGEGALNVHGTCSCGVGAMCADFHIARLGEQESCLQPLSCDPCPEDMYCTTHAVFKCPLHSSSPQNSSSIDECTCQSGYYRMNHTCLSCPKGYYCENQAIIPCTDFDQHLTGFAEMSTTRKEACVCERGFFRVSHNDTCKECPRDFFCPLAEPTDPLPNVIACMKYGFTLATKRWSFQQCFCEAGLRFSDDSKASACVPCAPGERCQDGFVVEEFCHLQSRTANTDHSECVCLPGFWEDSARNCRPCATGTVKVHPGNGVCAKCAPNTIAVNTTHCEPCPASSHAAAGSTECICDWPLTWKNGGAGERSECQPCGVDHFFRHTQGTNNLTQGCQRCPPHSGTRNTTGGALLNACRCDPGYVLGTGVDSVLFCEACATGLYEKDGNCVSCGRGASSSIASATAADCSCNASLCQVMVWTDTCFGSCQENTEPCLICAEGSYKPDFSPEGNTKPCEACPQNSFQPAQGSLECVQCHYTRENRITGQHNATACTCRAGHEPAPSDDQSGLQPCVPCALGYYKSHHGNTKCELCEYGEFSNTTGSVHCIPCVAVMTGEWYEGASTTLTYGSIDIQNCTCDVGKFLHDDRCKSCVRGTYKEEKGLHPCSLCGVDELSHQFGVNETGAVSKYHCVDCPAQSGNNPESVHAGLLMNSINSCLCFPAHDTFSLSECVPCEEFKFKVGYSNSNCSFCDTNQYWESHNTLCVECTLKNSEGSDTHNFAVQNIPPYIQWGRSQEDCTCDVGYARIQDECHVCEPGHYRSDTEFVTGIQQCVECPSNTYQYQEKAVGCISCPANSFFNGTGGTEAIQCLCDDGFFWDADHCEPCSAGTSKKWSLDVINEETCAPCVAGKYSLGEAAECTACGDNMFSYSGANHFDACYCVAAFGITDSSDVCELCPNATFAAGGALPRQSCTPCPAHKTSPQGSIEVSNCVCAAGHGIAEDALKTEACEACTTGKFSHGGSNYPCDNCGWGTVTEPALAAIDFQNCMCNADIGLHYSTEY